MKLGSIDAQETAELIDVSLGRLPADVVIRGGRVIDVYTERTTLGDISIKNGRIAYVGGDLGASIDDSTRVFDAEGAMVLPGYIEPHCHPWALYNPHTLAQAVLPLGNTLLVGELLNLQLALRPEEVSAVFQQLQESPIRWLWAVRVAGQSAQPLDGPFSLEAITELLAQDDVVQIAEVDILATGCRGPTRTSWSVWRWRRSSTSVWTDTPRVHRRQRSARWRPPASLLIMSRSPLKRHTNVCATASTPSFGTAHFVLISVSSSLCSELAAARRGCR